MDPTQRETILQQLYDDKAFARLTQPQAQFEHILATYLDCPPVGGEKDSWLQQLLSDVDGRLKEWSDTNNRKSYKVAKKWRDSARKVLELLDKTTGGGACETTAASPDEEEIDFLARAEQYYSRGILSVPYVATEQITHGIDKVAKLKVALFQERAEVRYRAGKFQQAMVDVALALHHCDHIDEQFSGQDDLKVLAVRCFAELDLIERDHVDDVIDFISSARGKPGDEPTGEEGGATEEKDRYQVLDSLKDMIDFHGQMSNFHEDNAPQLGEEETEHEKYFRYQLAEEKVEVKWTPHKGRHFIARQAIPAGTWILSEKPYSSVVHKDFLASKCNYCLKDLEPKDGEGRKLPGGGGKESFGYPCDYCKEVRFCCLDCADEAYHSYHRHECGILGFLLRAGPLAPVHVYRILSMVGLEKALTYERTYKSDSFTVEEYLAERGLRSKGTFALSGEERLTLYRMASTLTHHSDKYTVALNAWHAVQALDIALALLVKHPATLTPGAIGSALGSLRTPYDVLLELLQLCLVQLRRISVNVFGAFDYEKKRDGVAPEKRTSATVAILVGSLVNHSCAPNVQWTLKGGHVLFRASRAIEAGEELNITYGQTRAQPFQERQNALAHYHFACSCTLCRTDVATLEDVPRCLVCKSGPLVTVRNSATCLDCHSSGSASEAKKATEEMRATRRLLKLYLKMVGGTCPATMEGLANSALATAQERQREAANAASILGAVTPLESGLRHLAFRGTSGFTGVLRSLAQVYLGLGQLDRALQVGKLYEDAQSQIEASGGGLTASRPSRATVEDQLSELNFWTDICRKYFDRLVSAKRAIDDDRALQVTILLYVRFLKLAITYLEDRVGASQLGSLSVGQLLQRAAFNDAKLVYILAEKKKTFLAGILRYAQSICT